MKRCGGWGGRWMIEMEWFHGGTVSQPAHLTSAVRYSKMAALYTAAVAPTLPWLVVRNFKCRWILPTGNCRPARADRDTAFAFTLASFPALPPAWGSTGGVR